jgi:phage tail sheath protein FI
LLTGGVDGDAATLEDYKGDEDEDTTTGFAGLAEKEDVSIVCAPNENDIPGLGDEVVSHCERLNCFAILQCKQDAGDVGDLYPADGKVNSKYAAFYYPWLKITDPETNREKFIPAGGHMAGIYARTDTERGVHKAPANESVRGIIDLQFNLTTGQQDVLNPRGVNCIRFFMGRGMLVWGARTTSDDPLWKYINVRRLFIFLEKSIQRSTQWVVFEPNNEALWARLKQGVSDWLTSVWRDGALMGTTPEEAFFVKCDRTTMTENDIETGRLIMIIGVAPTRPAEFVIFRLAQWRSGSAITE